MNNGKIEFAVTFQAGAKVGARSFRTIYVKSNSMDEAIDSAEAGILKSEGGSEYTYKEIRPF